MFAQGYGHLKWEKVHKVVNTLYTMLLRITYIFLSGRVHKVSG